MVFKDIIMKKDYRLLTESVRNRINPDKVILTKAFTDELSTISYSDVLVYIRMAMKGVEPEYTQKSREAGEKVKNHLVSELKEIVFRYQGSVMTDTHIKGHSDIDLLTISDKFYTYDRSTISTILNSPEIRTKYLESSISKLEKEHNVSSYAGNSIDDLKNLRSDCERILSGKYITCDLTKPKSIKIKNLNLDREVDVVVANWYDDVKSIINDKGDYRGIQIYHKDTNSKGNPDYPFISIERINQRSAETNGRLKRMIRFIKNVKADSKSDIDLSSFDINAICYDIKKNQYEKLSFYELVPVLYSQLRSICYDSTHADNLASVDGREYIFRDNPTKLNNLKLLLGEIEAINADLTK